MRDARYSTRRGESVAGRLRSRVDVSGPKRGRAPQILPVADSPERSDHVRVARQLEGRREVDRFVEKVSGLVAGRLASGQVGELCVVKPDRDQAGDRKRVLLVVAQDQLAL